MRLCPSLQLAGGLVLVLTALALSLPGVQVARAGDQTVDSQAEFEQFLSFSSQSSEAPAAAHSGPSCRAGSADATKAKVGALMAQIQREMAARGGAQGEGEVAVTVLNARGYNYGSQPSPQLDFQKLEYELKQR
jgi:hypothetical protein